MNLHSARVHNTETLDPSVGITRVEEPNTHGVKGYARADENTDNMYEFRILFVSADVILNFTNTRVIE